MRIPKTLGTVLFWLSWPALWLYLKDSKRSRAIIVWEDKVLIVKAWLGTNDWSLPGGGNHGDESPLQTVEREVQEETGIDIKMCEKRELFTDRHVQEYGFSYSYTCFAMNLSHISNLVLQKGEIVEAKWINPADVPKNIRLSRVTKDALTAWSEQRNLVH